MTPEQRNVLLMVVALITVCIVMAIFIFSTVKGSLFTGNVSGLGAMQKMGLEQQNSNP